MRPVTNFPTGGTPTHFNCRSVRIYLEEKIPMLNGNGEEKVQLASEAVTGIYKLTGKRESRAASVSANQEMQTQRESVLPAMRD